MLRILLLFLCMTLVSSVQYFAQDDPVMVLTAGKKGIVDKFGRKVDGATISIKQDGRSFKTLTTASNGKYDDITLPYDHVYEVAISKGGYVKKVTLIDAKKGYFPEDIMEKKTEIEFVPEMIVKQPGVDYSVVTNTPVAKARIDPATGEMNYDYGFISRRSKEIKKFIDGQANQEKENDTKFNAKMSAANKAFSAKDYQSAIDNYKAAKALKPDHPGIDAKITNAQNKLEENKANAEVLAKFNAKIKEGDNLVNAKKYDEGIKKYEEAKSIKSGDPIPDKKIAAARKKKDESLNAANNTAYAAKLKEAKAALDSKKYENAKGLYQAALEIKPNERFPSDKIKEIDGIIANKSKYDALITEADNKFEAKEWKSAKLKYQEALKIIHDSYPTSQITKINAELQKLIVEQEKREKYDALVAKANTDFGSKKYELAKSNYQAALKLYDESHPKDQLAKIAELLKEQEADKLKKNEFNALMAQGQKHYVNNEWEQAKTAYKSAQQLIDDPSIAQKLSMIDKKVQEEKDATAAAEQKKKKDDEFNQVMARAQGQFDAKNWEEAKKTYKEALQIYSRKAVTDKIAEIELNIQRDKNMAKAAEAAKVKEDKYAEVMAKGKAAFDAKNWNEARTSYNAAIKLFDRPEARSAIAAIVAKIKEENAAKAAESAEKAKREQYDQLIATGDNQFKAKDWIHAKASYNKALSLFPEEYPKGQLAKIKTEQEKERAEQSEAANKAKITAQYNAKIKQADAARNIAKDGPGINAAIALYREANEIKNDETYPAEEVAKLQEKLNVLDGAQKAYDKLVNVANQKFADGDYEKAKELFTRAKGMHPEDAYPPKKLNEIDRKIKELKDKEAAEAREKEKRAKYDALISTADGHMTSENWSGARTSYAEALKLYQEEYPKSQLALITKKMREAQNAATAEAAEKAKRAKYDALIAKSDASFSAKKWEPAKNTYRAALNIYDEQYPKDQLAKIEKAIQEEKEANILKAEAAKVLAAYKAKIKEANAARDVATDGNKIQRAISLYKEANAIKNDETYPATEVAKLQEKLDKKNEGAAAYNKLIAVADKKFAEENYKKAKDLYVRARGLRSTDRHPPSQIRKINAILKEREAEAAKQAKYDKLISTGDTDFNSEKYREAYKSYRSALAIKPQESYPASQIAKIKKWMARNNVASTENKTTDKRNYNADELYGEDITGQYSDEDLNKLFSDNKVESDNWRDEALDKIKASEIEFHKGLDENSEEKSGDNFQKYEDYKQELEEEDLARDLARGDVIEGMENDSEERAKEYAAQQIEFTERTYESYEDGLSRIERKAHELEEINRAKEMNVEAYEKYKDEHSFWDESSKENALSRTEIEHAHKESLSTKTALDTEEGIKRRELTAETQLENNLNVSKWNQNMQQNDDERNYRQNEYQENLKDQLGLEANVGDKRRTGFIANMESFKNNESDLRTDRYEKNESRTYSTHQSIEDKMSAFEDVQKELEQPRLKYVDSYESYKDDMSAWSEGMSQDGINKTYSKHNYIENYKVKSGDFKDNMDVQRQKNVSAVEERKDKLENSQIEAGQYSKETTYKRHLTNEEFVKKNEDMFQYSDEKRQFKAAEMEQVKDDFADARKDNQSAGSEKSFKQQQAFDDQTTAIDDMLSDADVPRQKTVSNLTNYQDQLSNEKAAKLQDLEESYDNRRLKYEQNSNIKADENKLSNQLAEQYDEGVTEKVYQQKDARGNVKEITVVRVVVIGNKGHEYKMIKSRFAERYFKDGTSISETTWDTETTVPSE